DPALLSDTPYKIDAWYHDAIHPAFAARLRIVTFFLQLTRPPPSPTLFPYTTLFRSVPANHALQKIGREPRHINSCNRVELGIRIGPEEQARFLRTKRGQHCCVAQFSRGVGGDGKGSHS